MNLRDFSALRGALVLLASIAIVGMAAVAFTGRLVDQAESEAKRQQAALQEARLRYQRSGDEKDTIVRYLDGYEQLGREGVVGEERRINWIDGLRTANIDSELFGVDYQIGVQQPYSSVGSTGGIELRQSEMKIRLPLLHEGDLLRFLATLKRQHVGLFIVDQCTLDRINQAGGSPRYQPNLMAECTLSWITVVEDSVKDRKA
jgi:type II secretory pathway pseudopilin PulG